MKFALLIAGPRWKKNEQERNFPQFQADIPFGRGREGLITATRHIRGHEAVIIVIKAHNVTSKERRFVWGKNCARHGSETGASAFFCGGGGIINNDVVFSLAHGGRRRTDTNMYTTVFLVHHVNNAGSPWLLLLEDFSLHRYEALTGARIEYRVRGIFTRQGTINILRKISILGGQNDHPPSVRQIQWATPPLYNVA